MEGRVHGVFRHHDGLRPHGLMKSEASRLAARFAWLFVGPTILVIVFFTIVDTGSGWLTLSESVYFLCAALVVVCRWLEQRSGEALTATLRSANWHDFRRYTEVFAVTTVGAWLVANLLGNHLLHMALRR